MRFEKFPVGTSIEWRADSKEAGCSFFGSNPFDDMSILLKFSFNCVKSFSRDGNEARPEKKESFIEGLKKP